VDAEVIEYSIQKDSSLTRTPLRNLKLPANAIIGVVIRNEETIIPTGDFVFKVHDKVIILSMPNAIVKVEDMFR